MSDLPTVNNPQSIVDSLIQLIVNAKDPSLILKLNSALAILLSHPSFLNILGKFSFIDADNVSTPPEDNTSTLNQILATLSSLTKAIASQKAATPLLTSPKTPTSTQTLSNPPPRKLTQQLPQTEPSTLACPALISASLNAQLPLLYPQKVHITAVHWMSKGNLIITAGASTPRKILHEASPHIGSIIHKSFRQPSAAPSVQHGYG
ncbi:hypothetical protein BC827DRAFT_1274021 [Russula dissimulans]|nr:hypothetical protein BC827DRAFT_1274021 [Russula dissimulans]